MKGLIEHLIREKKMSRLQAAVLASKIVREKAERNAAKKIELTKAQILLPFDGVAAEEATHPTDEVDPDLPF